ncbi:centrosomal protein of 295 kDa isoform X2 [Eptesicus fuscus]|uniref:centrosomal protein of 295 kDa isoform X2 n=1 Tax=Eptesicus fuscus TaxID=29078 RepID=UPI00240406FB|nr:centrosomal protein of 295 kDa isoform X2 [Eptesicus fuscus]
MKRKVVNPGKMRLSPNEEAFILKEDYERRRKLRLLQVREQERDIALQRREDIKQRRNRQFNHLAEALRAEWEESQTQKINNLEKLYLASLRSMGEGHQQAKENEPDLNALAQRAAERKRKAELRHKEALKVQKNQKEMSIKRKTWHIKARKEALLAEKERSAKIISLPPPPPTLFENIEVKRTSNVKTNSSTYHHLYAFVNRETDTEQPDPHLAAEEEAKRLEEVEKQAEKERMEQTEKAHVRGFQAMKKIHLAQNQEKLMKELKQLQQEDLARRRQTVARMPPQLVALPYKRSEMKEDWQRELEFAFEDMYNADRKVKGNLILHLEPEPLPTVTDQIQDEELDLSMEQENLGETEKPPVTEAETICPDEADVPLAMKTQPLPSKIIFKKLLNKIRNQKSLWTIKSMSEDESEMTTTISEAESKAPTFESETIEEGTLSSRQEQVESDMLTVDSGPLTSEDQPISCDADSKKEQEINETEPITAVAQSSVLLHPQEEAIRIRMAARQKQIMEIEEQKQKQLELLEQIEQQKLRLETDCFRAQLEEEKIKKPHQAEVGSSQASCTISTDEDSHRQMIRNYQHQLLQQKRLHTQSVETARKQLLQYQTMLKGKYPSMPAASSISDSVVSAPLQKYERPTIISELWDQGQRPKLSPNKYEHIQPTQIPQLGQDYFQVPRQNRFPQRQVGTTETDVLAKKCLGSQEQPKEFSQTETQQRDYKSVPKDSHILSRTLSHDRPLILQHANEVAGTLDSQQMFSENNENTSSKPREPSSYLPLLAEHSFISQPTKVESGKIQEPSSTMSKDTVRHSVISQMQDKSLPSSGNITAQKGHLKLLQEQLDLQKEVLRSRQAAQEQLLLGKQKDLEGETGTSIFLPLVPMDSFASLPSVRAESGRIQEPSPSKNDTAVPSGHPGVPQLQDRLLGFSQSILSQQENLKFLHEQLNIQRDSIQARREAQEVLHVHKQGELGGRVWSEQTEPPSLPSQVAQHTFPPFVSAGTQSGKIWEQCSSKNEEGLFSNQSEIPKSQDGSLSFLQQFLPLHNSLKLLQEQLTAQRDALQARHEAQMELLSHRQRDLRDSKSGQMSSSFPPMGAQRSAVLQASVKTEPRRIENPYLSEKERTIPTSRSVIPTFQDEPFSSPQHSLPQKENLTALQSEFEKGISSEQTDTSLSLTQVAESERCREFSSSDSAGPLSHSKIPRFPERFLRFSQGHLEEHQEWLATEEALHFSKKAQGNISSEQTGSSFVPQLGHLSFASVPSESGKTQEPFSTERDDKIPSSHFQIPELQDRLLKISQRIQPQQDNLKALQERLAAQREAIIQSRQEAQEEHEQREWREGISPEQAGTSSFLPLRVQYSFASLPLTESDIIQEPCPTESDNTASSSHSEIPRLPPPLLGLSQSVVPQLILPRQNKFEEKLSSEHFIQPHHRDLMVLQQQLDLQREAIRFRQEAQEELLSKRLSKLDKRVSSEQVSSSLALSQIALPVDSERIQKSFPTRSQDRLLSFSQPSLPQQVHLTAHLDLQNEMVHSDEKAQEELLLTRKGKLIETESSAHTIPSLFLPKEREHSFISLPFAEVKYKDICESDSSRNEHTVSSSDSVIPKFQGRLLSFSQSNLAQQHNLGLQKQLDLQREVLHYSQKAQEELLVQRQTALQQQIQKHQETLKDFLKDSQTSKPTPENDLQHQMLREWLPHFQDQARGDHEKISSIDRSNSDDNQLLSEGEHLNKELGRRASKPPVAKVKCGLDLNQHELSVIQEVESPASGRPSILGNLDFYQDRDPLRVSISREQSFLGTPLDCDPFAHPHPIAQENICGDNSNETVKVKEAVVENQAVLSYAVDKEERTYLSAAVRPVNKAETQEIYHEPLSSITISTGSLSNENTDLSFTDPELFSEHVDHGEQGSTTGKEAAAAILSSTVPPSQVINKNSWDVLKPLSPAAEKFIPGQAHIQQTIDKYINETNLMTEKTDLWVDLDFPELEYIFPSFHRQLFKPLEPQPDFDLSSLSSGISQESRDFYQQSSEASGESHHATLSPRRTASFTALRRTSLPSPLNTRPSQPPDPNQTRAAALSFGTESIIEGSEQSFQQLLPEFSSQEGSQHADLPSIFSIEARDSSQGMENQYSSEPTEVLQNKGENVHFQLSVGNLKSSVFSSSAEANVFHQLNIPHSTPCGSTTSECSMKDQLEGQREGLGFEELSERGVDKVLHRQGLAEENKNETCGVLSVNLHVQEIDSQLCVRTVEMGTSVQIPHTIQNEKYFENSIKAEIPKIIPNRSQPSQSELFFTSGSFPLQSSIPVWETESGHGIMEEPELTLVSTSDISITEMDFANLSIEEKDEAKSFQESEFLPLVPETENSAQDHSVEETAAISAETLSKFTPAPGSLQEAFAMRKKSFIERSCQRQKEIRNKIHENQVVKATLSIGSPVSGLKSKVRVSLPKDRKTAQALKHQRTLRLHNQLAEVKRQKEEKAKQEAYAQNRARAKEFHKKTLEKLRAKNTC